MAVALSAEGDLLCRRDRCEQAEQCYLRAIAIAESAARHIGPLLRTLLLRLSQVQLTLGKQQAADESLRRAGQLQGKGGRVGPRRSLDHAEPVVLGRGAALEGEPARVEGEGLFPLVPSTLPLPRRRFGALLRARSGDGGVVSPPVSG